jgi:predicted nucleotidyltransferase
MADERDDAVIAAIEAQLDGYPDARFRERLRRNLERSIRMTTSIETAAVTPYVMAQDIEPVIAFAKQTFGAEEIHRSVGSAGGIHCELRMGDSVVFFGGAVPAEPADLRRPHGRGCRRLGERMVPCVKVVAFAPYNAHMEPQRVDEIARRHGITLLLQFGSTVTGRTHPRSDVDLGVLLERFPESFEAYGSLIADLQSLVPDREVDVAIVNRADPLFLKRITEEAALLYGPRRAFLELKIYAFKRYQDHRRYFAMEREYVARKLRAAGLSGT